MAENNERDREIADLKARLDALQQPTTPAVLKPAKRKIGCLTMIGGFLSLVVVAGLLRGLTPQTDVAATGPDLKPAKIACDEPWSKKVRDAASRLGVARGQAVDGLDVIVVVNPFSWSQMSLGSQRKLGLAVACEVPNGLGAVSVKFRYNRDGDDILRMPGSELYQLARGTFASAPSAPAPTALRGVAWGGHPPANLVQFQDSEFVWVGKQKPPPAFLGVTPLDEDYTFDHGRLFGGDVFFKGASQYAALKSALSTAYGAPSSVETTANSETYAWDWLKQKVQLHLTYEAPKMSTTLHYEKTS